MRFSIADFYRTGAYLCITHLSHFSLIRPWKKPYIYAFKKRVRETMTPLKTAAASSSPKKTLAAKINTYGAPVAFFLFFFFYLLWYIDPRVIYSCNGFDLHSYLTYIQALATADNAHMPREPSFHSMYILELTQEYFKNVFSIPGGLTRFIVTAVIYSCHYALWGALVLTAFALLLYSFSRVYVRRCGVYLPIILRFVPPVFILLMCQWYDLNCMVYCVPAAVALLSAIAYQALPLKTTAGLAAGLTVFFWMTYYFFQWASLLFALLICIDLLYRDRRALFTFGVTLLVNGGIMYLVESTLLAPENSFSLKQFVTPSVFPLVIVSYFPLVTMLCGPAVVRLQLKPPLARLQIKSAACLLPILSVILAAGAALWLSGHQINREIRVAGRILHYEQNRQWDRILQENTSAVFKESPGDLTQTGLFVTHATNYALCQTGQLGSKMFFYPQSSFSSEPLFLLRYTLLYGFVNWVSALDLFMDLGMLNQAEKTAGEAMENMGPYPYLMYRRALIQLAKGNNEAASVYLRKLRAMPFFRKEARQLLTKLDDETAIASDTRIAPMRASMDTSDYFLFEIKTEDLLLNLLKSNPRNKMAYDYLMALYLQTGQTGKLAGQIGRVADFGYKQLPQHWDEALCIYLSHQDSSMIAAGPALPVRPLTLSRLGEFMQSYGPYEDDPAKQAEAVNKLEDSFGATYFYFYTFQMTRGARR